MTITSNIKLPASHPFSGRDVTSTLAARIAKFGDRPFLMWEPPEGESATWSYEDFGSAVDRAAAGLAARGVGRGDGVMLFLENAPAFLITWFACARLGAVAVDTNVRYVADEVADALELTEPVGVVTHSKFRDLFDGVASDIWCVEVDETTGTCPTLDGDPADLPAPGQPDPAAAVCVQFTSGTTARPKAAVYTNANVLWAAEVGANHSRLHADDVQLVHAPLFHTVALLWQTLPTLWVGGSVVVVPKYSRTRFWDVSMRHGCTRTFFLPLMAGLGTEAIPDHSYTSMTTGAEVPAIEQLFGIRIQSSWGMTEVVTSVINNDPIEPSTEMSIGRVTTEYSVRVVAVDGDDAGSEASEGELRVHGVPGLSLFAGYHRNPEATADGFDDQGYWCTGDLVQVLPGGDIKFLSRIKDMLRVGGENVAAAEIERVLAEHPAVSAAGVVGHPDPAREQVPIGFVVAPDAGDGFEADIIAHCAERLADFKVPRRVHLIDELPESLIGKTSKKLLEQRAIELGLGD